jgi:hypothetical protein
MQLLYEYRNIFCFLSITNIIMNETLLQTKQTCLKKTQKAIKISPNPAFSKRGTLNYPPFGKGGARGDFKVKIGYKLI